MVLRLLCEIMGRTNGTGVIGRIRTAINTIRGSLSGASSNYYSKRGLDEKRSEGERPYQDLDDEEIKLRYVQYVGMVRDSDGGGFHLSPYIDKGWNLRQEWRTRDNDIEELNAALREAGYEVESIIK